MAACPRVKTTRETRAQRDPFYTGNVAAPTPTYCCSRRLWPLEEVKEGQAYQISVRSSMQR